jgi:hypothetical protein
MPRPPTTIIYNVFGVVIDSLLSEFHISSFFFAFTFSRQSIPHLGCTPLSSAYICSVSVQLTCRLTPFGQMSFLGASQSIPPVGCTPLSSAYLLCLRTVGPACRLTPFGQMSFLRASQSIPPVGCTPLSSVALSPYS